MLNIYKNTILFLFVIWINNTIAQQQSIYNIAREGSLADLKSAYYKNPDIINQKNKQGYTPLTLACYYGNLDVAKFLIDKVKDINVNSNYGTPLMAAVVKNNKELIALLLEKKIALNVTDPNGTSALHYAVIFEYTDIVEMLVNAKIDTSLRDYRGKSAFDYANIKGNTKIIQLLKNN